MIICTAIAEIAAYRRIGQISVPARSGWKKWNRDAFILAGIYAFLSLILLFMDRTLFDLTWSMGKIEIFVFGGGYTALTLMFHEVVEARQWLDEKMLMAGIAMGQVTPGPILIRATFVGYVVKGVIGAVLGTAGIFCPGLFMITAFLPVYDRFRFHPVFMRAIHGVVCCFVGLRLFVTMKFALGVHWDLRTVLLLLAALVGMFSKIDILYVVFSGALVSIFFCKKRGFFMKRVTAPVCRFYYAPDVSPISFTALVRLS